MSSSCKLPVSLEESLLQLIEEHGSDQLESTLHQICQNQKVSAEDASSNRKDIITSNREQEVLLHQAILDASFDAMFAIDPENGIIQMVNQAAVEVFGYSDPSELVNRNIRMIVGAQHAARHDHYIQGYHNRHMKQQQQQQQQKEQGPARAHHLMGNLGELPARRKDGSEFPVHVGLRRVPMDFGKDWVVGFVRDISDKKESEQWKQESASLQVQHERDSILHEKDQKIRAAILDASFDAMFAINTYGIIQQVNRAAVKNFGYESEEELLGQNISIVVGGGHGKHHDAYLKKYRETGETHIIGSMREVTARRKNGEEFPVILGIEVIPDVVDENDDDKSQSLLVAFIHDITEQKKATELEIEIRAAEELLANMLPEEIAKRLKSDPTHMADHHDQATILFADIVGFTAMSSTMSPVDLVKVLNDLFTRFDNLVDRYGLNKVKTIGDCYMVTSIPSYQEPERASAAMCHFSLDMIAALKEFNKDNPDQKLDLRVGINTGPVVAGIVGTSRFLYDLWGDSVNVASRMESTGVPSRVQITQSVVDDVTQGEFEIESRGEIQCKGKGLVSTFFLNSRLQPNDKYHMACDKFNEEGIVQAALNPSTLHRKSVYLQDAIFALQSAAKDRSLSPPRYKL